MANRHLSRSIVMQSLFEWDFAGCDTTKVPDILARNIKEFGPALTDGDKDFIADLAEGVIDSKSRLDSIIEKAARDWPIDQTPVVDRNVLRIGLYELLFAPKEEVPARVAINEAIELGKTFGGEKSGKFVNGVLGTVYKEMGEPGKDDAPKKKKIKDLTPEEREALPLEQLGGAVVYTKGSRGQTLLAFVHDIFGYWTLSKGHIEEGKNVEEDTAREIKEEMNLDIVIEKDLGSNEYVASDPEKGKIRKRVSYFLAHAAKRDDLKLKESGGLNDIRWFSLSEIAGLRMYEDIRPIIDKGIALLAESEIKKS